ncbi:MAG: putative hydrolase of the superfamily [Patescibacteria group bacterium]|nr:putative hydrolase of the superfamily [Patescibacteria group bacterium]
MVKAIIFDIFGVFYKPKFLVAGTYDEKMIALVKELKSKGLKVFAISNSFDSFAPLHEVFDKIYFAGEIGFYKPDPEPFLYVLKKENLTPEECVYFDDSKSNVDGGRKVLIPSFLFESVDETTRVLKEEFKISF